MPNPEIRYGGLIGRFQPWHGGHQRMLKAIIADGRTPVIFLGSSNADRDREANPFTVEERISIIRQACEKLTGPDGKKVEPIFIPVFDYRRPPEEIPYEEDGEKRVPLNSAWFAQFVRFFEERGIRPEDFTLFYTAKDEDKKNYVFQPDYESGFSLPVAPGTVAHGEDLSYAFTLMGARRKKISLSGENARDIRKDFLNSRHLLVDGCYERIMIILQQERLKNADYDGSGITDDEFAADPLAVLRHERHMRADHLNKFPADPSFHRRVMLVGADGALGLPVIERLVTLNHDLVLASPRPEELENNLRELRARYPAVNIEHVFVDMRKPETGEASWWEDLYRAHNVQAVLNMAGIIEEKPDTGLTFGNINYRPVPAMARACVNCGIDRYIYFSTVTAGSAEADANARQSEQPLTYAGSKRKAELALEGFSDRLNWFAVRPVTTINPQVPNWGRDMHLPDLANLPVVPIWGSGEQLMQPLSVNDLARVGRLVESDQKGGLILNVVGAERVKLGDILKALRRPDMDFSAVHIPYDRALRLARDYPLGGINEAFIRVMQKLETPSAPIDPKPWARAVGADGNMTRLFSVYNAAARGDGYANPPVLKYGALIARDPDKFCRLLKDSGASVEFIGEVKEAFARISSGKDALIPNGKALLGRIIRALGKAPEGPG